MSDTIMSKKIGIMAFLSSMKINGKQLNIREIFLLPQSMMVLFYALVLDFASMDIQY